MGLEKLQDDWLVARRNLIVTKPFIEAIQHGLCFPPHLLSFAVKDGSFRHLSREGAWIKQHLLARRSFRSVKGALGLGIAVAWQRGND